MGIDVRRETETAGELELLTDEGEVLSSLVSRGQAEDGATCLRFLDEYGDTVFNQFQLPVLAVELESLRKKLSAREAHHITKILALVTRATGDTHTYVRFIGD